MMAPGINVLTKDHFVGDEGEPVLPLQPALPDPPQAAEPAGAAEAAAPQPSPSPAPPPRQPGSGGGGGGGGGGSERSRPRNALERREWTAEEDEIIKDGVRQYGYRWRRIASQLQGRSDDAVRNRWSRLKGGEEGEPKAGLSKGGASGRNAAGDTGVTGDGGSPAAPPVRRRASASGEEGGAKPERIGWTQAEDAIIISSRIPGRTEHAIRNRWQRLLKMVEEQQAPPPPPPPLIA
ncbi:hypothetical protein EMIHUDRAFT_110461 [Emiliania huxleyi CCMP1516]|uniref:Uncharacterized protein n=2 Tax=Emiliania huxleyi TaxID=2903 RepID=A0A0D3KJT1_EMIH1|nr:hypothetical protein EMIHUDRAFT_110461 [Emiliania huxleyi CCMP1516]EOD36016.1 hypothetical protein EMIHUDRAFT_110461 [Emiliania huxleyi CCMP1516]|eukprot:XP_005788445.1 hypothetical protein EMIHUDRAFT_110461 [Emiliania huxleyi CCMP1516]